jgi:hypothetical protein
MMRRALAVVSMAAAIGLVARAGLRAQQGPPRDTPVAPLIGSATISGTVLSSPDAKPLGRAQLMILGAENGYMKIVESDAQGRFAFAQLPAGRYMIGASKSPYLDSAYGATRPGRPGTAISVTEGQRIANLAIKMLRGGVVTGFVTDERGQPLQNATVRLLAIKTKDGNRVVGAAGGPTELSLFLGNTGNGRTDERGIYRLYGIAPGEYAVAVTAQTPGGGGDLRVMTAAEIQAGLQAIRDPGQPGVERPSMGPPAPMVPSTGVAIPPPPGPAPPPLPAPSGPPMGFAPTYYPGSIDVADAAPVTVAAGEERGGVDIRTRLVPMVRVVGQVSVPFGESPTNVQVTLRPAGSAAGPSVLTGMQPSARVAATGQFAIDSVPPGRYTLTARTQPGVSGGGGRGGIPPPDPQAPSTPAAPPQALWATSDIVVSGQPVSGIVLTMQPGMTVSGKVVFKSVAAADPKNLAINVVVRPPQVESIFGSGLGLGNGTVVKADRTFTIEGLVPARYLLTAGVTPTGPDSFANLFAWTVEQVTIGGRDVTDLPIELKPNGDITDAVITLTDRKQEVFGTLKESTGRPAPDYTVVLFSTDRQYWLTGSRRIATARPATDGRFEVSNPQGLPPGTYFLAAITDLGADEQYDTKLLEDLSKAAVKLTLAPGERKQQELRIK